jgi:hypothetical protein
MYSNPFISYQCEHFQVFCDIVNNNFATITQDWDTDLNNGLETLFFHIVGHSYQVHIFYTIVGVNQPMCKDGHK